MTSTTSNTRSSSPGHQGVDGENVWATLPIPLCDLFLHAIVPHYLEVEDLVRLSAVSRRYHELFDASNSNHVRYGSDSEQDGSGAEEDDTVHNSSSTTESTTTTPKPGKRILAAQLRRSETKYNFYKVTDQLPTIGNGTVEESLQQNPLAVAQLRVAALGRRKLVLIEDYEQESVSRRSGDAAASLLSADKEEKQHSLRQIIAAFKPTQDNVRRRRPTTMSYMALARRGNPLQSKTTFVCTNHSGRAIYCHWIDFDGQLLVRDGDRLPSSASGTVASGTTENQQQQLPPPSFLVEQTGDTMSAMPDHTFIHSTVISHAFALCHEEGGTPFAIYQCRRAWNRFQNRCHNHAIVVWKGGILQEILCHSALWACPPLLRTVVCFYDIYDRETGLATERPATTMEGTAAAAAAAVGTPIPSAVDAQVNRIRFVADESRTRASLPIPTAVQVANKFYGADIPGMQHASWHGGYRAVQEAMGSPNQPLNYPSVLG